MSEIQARLSRRTFIGGQWRNAGDVVDITGYRQGAVEKMLDDGLLYFSSATTPVSSTPSDDLMNSFAETNLRLWQLEAGVIAETEGFAGWTGEAFLTNQNNVASATGDVTVDRAARLGGGGLSIYSGPLTGVNIGDPFMDGYFAGIIDTTQGSMDPSDASQTAVRYALILSPKSKESGVLQWHPTGYFHAGWQTRWSNPATQLSGPPAPQHCLDLAYPADGASRWYLPSLDEMQLIYRNFKPTTNNNYAGGYSGAPVGFPTELLLSGATPTTDPQQLVVNSASDPAQTPIAMFQAGGAEALLDEYYWTKTIPDTTRAYRIRFSDGLVAATSQTVNGLTRVRPVRQLIL